MKRMIYIYWIYHGFADCMSYGMSDLILVYEILTSFGESDGLEDHNYEWEGFE